MEISASQCQERQVGLQQYKEQQLKQKDKEIKLQEKRFELEFKLKKWELRQAC